MEATAEEMDKFLKENSRLVAEMVIKALLRDPECRKILEESEEKK
jgi:hypothetical protein